MRLPVLPLLALALAPPAVAADPPAVDDLFPLAVGRSWTYRVMTGPGGGQTERFVVRVAREEMVGSATCFRLEASLGDRVVATESVGLTADGLCRFKVEREEVTPPVPFLKTPKGGAKTPWEVPEYFVGSRAAQAKFWVEPANVTWKGKAYKGVKVRGESSGEGGGRVTIFTYAAGIGLVRQTFEGRGPQAFSLELESFDTGEAK